MKSGDPSKPRKPPSEELPWDLLDRALLPVLFSHAAALILSTLTLSHFSSFSLFLLFLVISLGSTLFYHNLKVTCAGKYVLIAGCETSIGLAAAKYLDDLGLKVWAGFNELGEASRRLKEQSSGRLQVLQLDLSSEASVANCFLQLNAALQADSAGLWAVVNAGSWAAFGEVAWVPTEVFRKSEDLHLLSSVRLVQASLPLLAKTKGRVVLVSSLLGSVFSRMRSPVCASRAALAAFAECLRLEIRPRGVDVVLIEVGQASSGRWFEEKEMLEQARRMWEGMTEEAKVDYGKDYFEFKIRTMPEYNSPESDLTAVLKSIGDAVTRTFPMARYTAVTGKEKLQALVCHHLPRSVYDIIYS